MNEMIKDSSLVGTSPVRPDGVPKVTGLAQFGDDFHLPGMLQSKVLRSPHAHARIKSIDTSKAEALHGVKAVITGADFPEHAFSYFGPARIERNYWHITRAVIAQEKALFEGHAVAAVAATTAAIAAKAAKLIEVDYEVLPHVIDVDEAMAEDAPVLYDDMITRGIEPVPTKPSNISKITTLELGDVEAGFAEADEIVEKEYRTAAVHQGYIEPHACLARYDSDGQAELWSSSQGHFIVREFTSKICGIPLANLKVNPAEIGGGFGGKTVVYVEPLARGSVEEGGAPGQGVYGARRGVQSQRSDIGIVDAHENRREKGRYHHRRRGPLQLSGRRVSGLAGSLVGLCAASRPMPSPTKRRPPAMLSRTGRKLLLIERRVRRLPPSPSKARLTFWPRRSAWIRQNCVSKMPPSKVRRCSWGRSATMATVIQ